MGEKSGRLELWEKGGAVGATTDTDARIVLLEHDLKKAKHEVEFWQTSNKANIEVAEQWKKRAEGLIAAMEELEDRIEKWKEKANSWEKQWSKAFALVKSQPEEIRGPNLDFSSSPEDVHQQLSRYIRTMAEKAAKSENITINEEPTDLPGSPQFHAILREIGEMHAKKSADYGSGDDPFANIRASAGFGVPPWVGAMIRGNDKVQRIQSFIANGKLENESLTDSLLDLASYAIIALCLFLEGKEEV